MAEYLLKNAEDPFDMDVGLMKLVIFVVENFFHQTLKEHIYVKFIAVWK